MLPAHFVYYYTSDSLWKIWFVESIQSIHNSLWTWHDKCNICCRCCIYHVKFDICQVTKPLGVFSSETEWLNVFFCLLFKKCIIKQFLNSVFTWYHELSKPCVCIISVLIIHDTSSNNCLILIQLTVYASFLTWIECHFSVLVNKKFLFPGWIRIGFENLRGTLLPSWGEGRGFLCPGWDENLKVVGTRKNGVRVSDLLARPFFLAPKYFQAQANKNYPLFQDKKKSKRDESDEDSDEEVLFFTAE